MSTTSIDMNHTPRPYNSETDLPAVLALKQVCTTPQNIYDRPTTSDLRRLLAPLSEPAMSSEQSWEEARRGMSSEHAQRAITQRLTANMSANEIRSIVRCTESTKGSPHLVRKISDELSHLGTLLGPELLGEEHLFPLGLLESGCFTQP